MNTAAISSSITYIDGDKGFLMHRGMLRVLLAYSPSKPMKWELVVNGVERNEQVTRLSNSRKSRPS